MRLPRIILLLLWLTPIIASAQSLCSVNPKGGKVRQMVCTTLVPNGQDMNRQETIDCNTDGVPIRRTVKGFGGEQTYSLPPASNIADCRIDADGDTVYLSYAPTPARYKMATYIVYRKPHCRSAAKTYCIAVDSALLEYYSMERYNAKGLVTRRCQYAPDDMLMSQTDVKYDKRGNKVSIKEAQYDEEGTKQTVTVTAYKYTYDALGNWTRCEHRYNGQLFCTVLREITYW
ncbi:MAG: hypothetical protein HUK02_09000 [Bacteroidaceae bacterium]|nr:hypothetical protein [Bacteroidaceae bacterium]